LATFFKLDIYRKYSVYNLSYFVEVIYVHYCNASTRKKQVPAADGPQPDLADELLPAAS
jgi:hypothetical protein